MVVGMKVTAVAVAAAMGFLVGGAVGPVPSSAGECSEWKTLSMKVRYQTGDSYVDENGDTWQEKQRITAKSQKRCHQYRTRLNLSDWVYENISDNNVP